MIIFCFYLCIWVGGGGYSLIFQTIPVQSFRQQSLSLYCLVFQTTTPVTVLCSVWSFRQQPQSLYCLVFQTTTLSLYCMVFQTTIPVTVQSGLSDNNPITLQSGLSDNNPSHCTVWSFRQQSQSLYCMVFQTTIPVTVLYGLSDNNPSHCTVWSFRQQSQANRAAELPAGGADHEGLPPRQRADADRHLPESGRHAARCLALHETRRPPDLHT